MSVMATQAWRDPAMQRSDPDAVRAILRDKTWQTADLIGYLDALAARGGPAFPHLRAQAAHGLAFMSGPAHLAARRALGAFFSARGAAAQDRRIAQAVDAGLARLAAAPSPDLMRDFAEESYLHLMRGVMALQGAEDDAVLEAARALNAATRPMLSLAALRRAEAGAAALSAMADRGGEDAPTLFAHLRVRMDDASARATTAAMIAASHTLAQTLAFTLYDLLTGDPAEWRAAAKPDWATTGVARALSRTPSTLTLARTRGDDCAVLNLPAANAALRARGAAHMSFGAGAHQCPGAALSTRFLARALPALATAWPALALRREGAALHVSQMVRHPVALPCTLSGENRRETARMLELRRPHSARAAVNDDARWGPPAMAPFLAELAARSGEDLSSALSVARNAMFFMEGPRHAAARRLVAGALGSGRIGAWAPMMEREIAAALDRLAAAPAPDLVRDFTEPLFRAVAGAILGVAPRDPARFHAISPHLQDVLEPLLPLRAMRQVQTVFAEALSLMGPPAATPNGPAPLLAQALDTPTPEFSDADLHALVLVLYGASYNLSHTLANVLLRLLWRPAEDRAEAAAPQNPERWADEMIARAASPRFIYRVARADGAIGDLPYARGHVARIALEPVARAVPALLRRFPDLAPGAAPHRFHAMTQTVAPSSIPCRLGDAAHDRP
jgi:cytochrome P450